MHALMIYLRRKRNLTKVAVIHGRLLNLLLDNFTVKAEQNLIILMGTFFP